MERNTIKKISILLVILILLLATIVYMSPTYRDIALATLTILYLTIGISILYWWERKWY